MCLVVAIFLFPETLFSRDPHFLTSRNRERTYWQMLWDFRGNVIPGRKLHLADFTQSFRMLKYPSITFPFFYYIWAWTFINVLPAISLAAIYARFYHLRAGPVGICLGVSLSIGSILGEICAGRASDYIGYLLAKRNGNVRKPEHRLYLSTLSAIFMPAGVIIFGACVGKTGYIPPLVGLSVGMSQYHSLIFLCLCKLVVINEAIQVSSAFKSPRPVFMRISQTATKPRVQRVVFSSTSAEDFRSVWDSSICLSQMRLASSGPGSRLQASSSSPTFPLPL